MLLSYALILIPSLLMVTSCPSSLMLNIAISSCIACSAIDSETSSTREAIARSDNYCQARCKDSCAEVSNQGTSSVHSCFVVQPFWIVILLSLNVHVLVERKSSHVIENPSTFCLESTSSLNRCVVTSNNNIKIQRQVVIAVILAALLSPARPTIDLLR